MTEARSAFSAVIGPDQKIYAIGGYNNGINLPHVERYDPKTNKWEMLTDMNEPHSSH